MKGKLWELGPFVLAVLVGGYFLAARLLPAPPPRGEPRAAGPRTGHAARASSGAGDPTKPSDFEPDPNSRPDPNSLPDPSVAPR